MYYVFCIFECLRAPRKKGKCSLGLPSLNKDFIIIIIIIIIEAGSAGYTLALSCLCTQLCSPMPVAGGRHLVVSGVLGQGCVLWPVLRQHWATVLLFLALSAMYICFVHSSESK